MEPNSRRWLWVIVILALIAAAVGPILAWRIMDVPQVLDDAAGLQPGAQQVHLHAPSF